MDNTSNEKIIICSKSQCTGCGVCADKCPVQCISMIYDKDGFLRSSINYDKCIHCRKCIEVCPTHFHANINTMQEVYKARRKDVNAIRRSTSGGIATLISEYMIKQGGYVVGCGFDENLQLKHCIVNELESLEKFKGSKYIQSQTKDIYIRTKELLMNNNKVLFIGTPCQVAGIVSFLGKKYENLYTIDLICHGVASQKVLDKYIAEIGGNECIDEIRFRNKENGYKNCSQNELSFRLGNQERILNPNKGIVLWFASSLSLRTSCYTCSYANINRCSDLTLGDYNGTDLSENDKKNGVSSVFVNTDKGKELWDIVCKESFYEKKDLETIVQNCYGLKNGTNMPKCRGKFFRDIDKMGICELEKKYILKIILPSKIIRHINAVKIKLRHILQK